jgi:hypothetical protein
MTSTISGNTLKYTDAIKYLQSCGAARTLMCGASGNSATQSITFEPFKYSYSLQKQ